MFPCTEVWVDVQYFQRKAPKGMYTVGMQSVRVGSLPPDPEEKGLSAEGHGPFWFHYRVGRMDSLTVARVGDVSR